MASSIAFYTISAPSAPVKKASAAELREAAENGMAAIFHGIPVHIACIQDGWVTAFGDRGFKLIFQGWPGEFSIRFKDFLGHYGIEAP